MSDGRHLSPIGIREANLFVAQYHRHCCATWRNGGKFAIALRDSSKALVGVVIVGRPVARLLNDDFTAEVLRLCVAPNAPRGACSSLYRAAWRTWRAMGGTRLVTYTLQEESGASLRGAGFTPIAQVRGHQWNRDGRHREVRDLYDKPKIRWQLAASCHAQRLPEA